MDNENNKINFNQFNNNLSNCNKDELFVNYESQIFNNNGSKNKIKCILTNKKFLMVELLLIFIFTCITVGKAIYLRNKVDNYEGFFTKIEEIESSEVKVYQDGEKNNNSLKDVAAFELVNCIQEPLDVNDLPDSISSIIDEINDYYNQSNNYFAFKYKDIYTGFSISYNENQNIFTASTIKAPKDIYIYEMACLGKIDLSEELMYTSGYYSGGTGVLKDKKVNTKYDIRTLVNYSIVYSDNIAHNMLMDKYGRRNMLEFWKEKGTTAIFTQNNNWGVFNAHDASIYMEELYRFYIDNEEYGKELMNNFINAKTKFILGKNGYKVANKSGWSGSAIHDVAIVFADNPYIVVGLSNLGGTDYYYSYFNKVNDFAYRLHTEYWKHKMSVCSYINQY